MNQSTDQRWSNIYKQGRDFRLVSSQEIDRFLSYASPEAPKTCLDLGCGTGQLTRELYHRGYQTTGVDASLEAIQRAQQLTTVPSDQLSYVHADIEHDDLRDKAPSRKSYGVIACKLVYAFIEAKPAFLEKVKDVLHPQGIFVVATPMIEDVEATKRAIAVSEEEIRLLESHFEQMTLYKNEGLTYSISRLASLAISRLDF